MELDKRPIYYVYEWYNVDTGEVFYVGKGRGDRCSDRAPANRNAKFIEYLKDNPNSTYRKVFENLDEETACSLEDSRIKELKQRGLCKCNLTDRTSHRGVLSGAENGFYGHKHTEASLQKMRDANGNGRWAGENNSQYGISPKERMTPEVYEGWLKHRSESVSGSGNSQYGISPKDRMTQEVYEEWHRKQCEQKIGKTNPKARAIYMYNYGEVIKFDCIKDCVEYLVDDIKITPSYQGARAGISKSLRKDIVYKGLIFTYVDESKKNKR